jgi:hypothetical protein
MFLIACRNARMDFLEGYHTLRAGQDNFSGDEDGADQSTHQAIPPVLSLWFTALVP